MRGEYAGTRWPEEPIKKIKLYFQSCPQVGQVIFHLGKEWRVFKVVQWPEQKNDPAHQPFITCHVERVTNDFSEYEKVVRESKVEIAS